MNAGQIIGFLWTLTAWWFVASTFAAPVVALVVKARARGKRKFADEPTARVKALHVVADHTQDAL